MKELLTKASEELFGALVKDAGNWSGTPLWDGNVGGPKGNLLDLKKKGLVRTFDSDGCLWVEFTSFGKEAAKIYYGVDIDKM